MFFRGLRSGVNFHKFLKLVLDISVSSVYYNIMALRIRLKRGGAKRQPCYRVVAMDARAPRDGRPIEELGRYQPASPRSPQFVCQKERVDYWIARGALMSHTVKSLINRYTSADTALNNDADHNDTTLTDPTLTDPTLTDPTLTDPTLTDPTLTDPTLTDPTLNKENQE